MVDKLLDCNTWEELVGKERFNPTYNDDFVDLNVQFDPLVKCTDQELAFLTFTRDGDVPPSYAFATRSWHRTHPEELDPGKLQPFFGWRPTRVIKKTLDVTTQLARMVINYPMRRHLLPRTPWMDGTRLDEVVSTDPMFANCPSLHDNYSGAQIYYGLTSKAIDVYGFKQESEFPDTLEDFTAGKYVQRIDTIDDE